MANPTTVEIPLSGRLGEGLFALVDDTDAGLVAGYRWVLQVSGGSKYYAIAHVPGSGKTGKTGRRVLMHNLIIGRKGIDHRDGNGLNNQRANLRLATQGQNRANTPPRAGTSRFKGVYWHERSGKWMARVGVNQKMHYLGIFSSEEDAARAYDAAALEIWGEYARPNFPLEA